MSKPKTVSELFFSRVSRTPYQPALFHKIDGAWESLSWSQYGTAVDRFAKALRAAGVEHGDRVALIGTNSVDWFVADMAIMTMGAVTVPIYWTSSGEQISYILKHSESRLLIADEIEYANRLAPHLPELPQLELIVLIRRDASEAPAGTVDKTVFLERGQSVPDDELSDLRRRIQPDTLSTFIYTSGTTGPPKAVMLCHRNSVTAARNVYLTTKLDDNSISCSYLPLSHIAERCINLLSPLLSGTRVYFMRGYEYFAEDLKEIRPTLWAGVPRVWEKLYEGIVNYKADLPDGKRRLIEWALTAGKEYNWRCYDRKSVSLMLRSKYRIARKLVLEKILASMGLDRVTQTVTGGAPTSSEILDFFMSIGLWLQDVYGQTEGHGVTSFCTKDQIRIGSAGKPYPLLEVRIAADGEILVRGDNVAQGYYKDPEQTRETFQDGWLFSGDLGRFDEDGFLWITGRKKDIIITSGGKNITPAKIESSLMSHPLIEHAVVVGDGKKYLTALLTVNPEEAQRIAESRGEASLSYDRILEAEFIPGVIDNHVRKINEKLSRVEQIKKYRVLPRPLSVEDGELTNLLKIKRYFVIDRYGKEIEGLYK